MGKNDTKTFWRNDRFNRHIEKCEFVAVLICCCFFTGWKMLKRNYLTAIRSNWQQQYYYWNKARYIHGFCTFIGFFPVILASHLIINVSFTSHVIILSENASFSCRDCKRFATKNTIELILSHQRKWLTRVVFGNELKSKSSWGIGFQTLNKLFCRNLRLILHDDTGSVCNDAVISRGACLIIRLKSPWR